ncbi:cell division protein ZapA [Herbaspirillum sp. RTI4]|uniref:cell division protein ZapA n=1 Tax=Herbaspirillum sp. RTI4 TaxID=3048640 RepID=UPI002AB49807|nr:cell division protein ZapA [Herbaspirillum sp. RTI4]MDY7579994.1 cell division protein ZapA [Herbaspirillum sp. RTI4]MEA9982808.1 cell division protein ZapA [Herbaspirillum sp. RTI4]
MIQLPVNIMGTSYTLACQEGQEPALQLAVAYLDEKMCSIRDMGKIKGTDRIAVTAALGIAAELLSTRHDSGPLAGLTLAEWKLNVSAMHTLLDQALTPQENLF